MKGNTVCISKRGGGSHTQQTHREQRRNWRRRRNKTKETWTRERSKKKQNKTKQKKQQHRANASPSYIVEKSSVPVHSRRSSTWLSFRHALPHDFSLSLSLCCLWVSLLLFLWVQSCRQIQRRPAVPFSTLKSPGEKKKQKKKTYKETLSLIVKPLRMSSTRGRVTRDNKN